MCSQPNILLIMSDEHAPQALGCYGADYVRSPAIDRLAREGVTFDNAYCNFALCVPSRNSFLAGLLPHKVQAYDNGSPLGSNIPTWAHMLRRAGYRCIMDGKMHMIGPDQWHGFHEHWGEGPHRVNGFRWGEETGDGTGYRSWSEVHVIPDEEFQSGDMKRRDAAVEFIENQDRAQPFCLCVGYCYPHYPMRVSESAFRLYDEVDIPPPVPREQVHPRNVHWSDTIWGFDKVTPEESRRSRQAYLTMVTMMDGWVGDLLAALERSGRMEETIVIYTSDHGDMWGEHDLWGKNLFYEESSRVPMVIRAPRFGAEQGRRIATPVSLVDLYPTLREMAGIGNWEVPLDGRSLWSTCRGAELPEAPVFCDYYSSDTQGPERMIRLGRWKLNYYHNQPQMELFDLENDPREMRNLADDPAHAQVRADLLRRMHADWDPVAIEADIRREQNRRTCIDQALRTS